MAILGSAVYELRTDNSKFNQGMDQAQKTAREKAQAIAGSMRTAGLALAGFGTAILAPLGLATKEASNLEESINAVNVVFQSGSNTIQEFGRTAATQVGLARSEFNQLATQTGALLTNFGFSQEQAAEQTIELTRRAADLASVHNTDVKDALSAINQALRGETEAIRRYAADVTDATIQTYLLNNGINAQVAGMSQAEKAQYRLRILMEQTAIVQGDFANTSDSAANAQRILSAQAQDAGATIGSVLLPVVQDLLKGLRQVLVPLAQWMQDNPKLTEMIVIGAAAIGVAAVAIGGLALALSIAIPIVTTFGVATNIALAGIPILIAAIVAGGVLLWRNWDWVKGQAIAIWNAIGGHIETVINWIIRAINAVSMPFRVLVNSMLEGAELIANAFGKELPGSVQLFRDVMNEGVPEVQFFSKIVQEEKVAAEEAADANDDLAESIDHVGVSAEVAGEKMMTANQLTVANQWAATEEFKRLYREQTDAAIANIEAREIAEAEGAKAAKLARDKRIAEVEADILASLERERAMERDMADFRRRQAEEATALAVEQIREEQRLQEERNAELQRLTDERIREQEREAAEQQRNLDAMQRGWDGYVESQNETILAIRAAGITFTDIINKMAEDAGLTAAEIAAQMMEMGVRFGDVMGLIDKTGTVAIEGLIKDFKAAQGVTTGGVGVGAGGIGGGFGHGLAGGGRTVEEAMAYDRRIGQLRRLRETILGGGDPGAVSAAINRYLDIRQPGDPLWTHHNFPWQDFAAFAKGGLVTRPTLGLVGEAGPEAIIPLDKMNGGMGTINVIFYGDVTATEDFEERVVDMVEVALRRGRSIN